jgi:hypothetical protein
MRACLIFLVTATVLCAVGPMYAQVTEPVLPNVEGFDLCMPDTTGYQRRTVGPIGRDHTDLQEAIDAATMRTVIVLDAGAVFNGTFTLRRKQGDGWIVITTSNERELPRPGTRVGPEHTSRMARIVASNGNGTPAIRTEPQAHHYRLVGLEITVAPFVTEHYGTVNLGEGGTAQSTETAIPHHLIIDRCYVHGHDGATVMKYGVRLDCAFGAVIDSYVAQYHSVGFDAQAISGINGPGPFLIENNYLEGSGENIMFGGGAPSISGLVPSDIVIRRNTLSKPLTWRVGHATYAGTHWTIKNHFELKTGRRVLVEGNVMETCWADLPIGQSGYAILLTVRTEGGKAPQADVSDVTIRGNIIRDVGAGISISGNDGPGSNRSARILIEHNRFENINGPEYGDGNVAGPNDGTFLKIGDPRDVVVRHNTIEQTGPITWAINVTEGFMFTYNRVQCQRSAGGYQGIYGPGLAEGNATLSTRFPDITDANRHFHGNALIGGVPSRYDSYATMSHNLFPERADGLSDSIGVNMALLDSVFSARDVCEGSTSSVPTMVDAILPTIVVTLDHIEIDTRQHTQGRYAIVDGLGRIVETGHLDHGHAIVGTGHLGSGVYLVDVQTERCRRAVPCCIVR